VDSEVLRLQKTLYTSKNPTRRWLHCTRRDWIIAELQRLGGPRQRALEVGFGSGIYLPHLAALYSEVVAIDLERAFIDHGASIARELPNLRVIADDITASKLDSNAFDLILCSEVIEHIPDWTRALAEMHRVLKPGGTLILSTPQPYSPLELLGKIAFKPGIVSIVRLVYGEEIVETGHVNLRSQKQIMRELDRIGFRVKKRFKTGVYLPGAAEFMGNIGLRIEQWLEPRMRDGPLDQLLWVQFYVAEK
jgi:2-polyprenyl-3-methyl-5-hydroxy-6-metoxy-1,4-benzoquinol methylase